MNGIETQVVNVLAAIALALISSLSVKAHNWVSTHTAGKKADVANKVIDGLDSIAENVVHDFNQRVVNDAIANGVWTAELGAAIKQDAIRAVIDQGGALVDLGQGIVGNIPEIVSGMVEKYVQRAKTTDALPESTQVSA